MQQANLYQQYKTQSLETLTQGEIVVKLFEEASKQISMGIFFANNGNSYRSFNGLSKAQKIFRTLDLSLDMKYSISSELSSLYMFLHDKLGEAARTNNVALMKDLLEIADELKVTFRQADKLARVQK